ncbi:MAG: GNAT family N-acetyltransferase [Akkermansiaceae bacterium]
MNSGGRWFKKNVSLMGASEMVSTIYYLEMKDRRKFLPKVVPEGFSVARVMPPEPLWNARLYREVGGGWQWTDRLSWSEEEWSDYAGREAFETWRAELEGEEAGYFELERQEGGSVEILYFGLLPAMIGKGLGGAMLSMAIERAWEIPGTVRVWVHTCTEDHEHALVNYRRRGFEVFKVEEV